MRARSTLFLCHPNLLCECLTGRAILTCPKNGGFWNRHVVAKKVRFVRDPIKLQDI